MACKRRLIGTILLFCFNTVNANDVKEVDTFDLLIFTQSWPSTVCKIWTHKNPSHTCTFPTKRDSWTIHGVWPTIPGTIGPAFCNKTWLFDPEQIKPIEDELEQSWRNIEKETNLYDLWAHEWNKHGTCAAILEPFNSELKYFSKGISLLLTYSMTNILKVSDILPSDEKNYTADQIFNAVKKAIGKNPMVECKFEDHIQYLQEVRLCFSKNLELVDCDGVLLMQSLTNCDKSHGVLYPHYEELPNTNYVQLYKFVNWLQWYTL